MFCCPWQCFEALPQQWLALLASQQAYLPFLATLRSQKGWQVTQEVWPQCVVAGVLKCQCCCVCAVFHVDPMAMLLKHCHNNGWLSLPHSKPICHFWQHSGVKKEGRRPKRYGHMVCCGRCLEMQCCCVCAVFHVDPMAIF